MKTFSNNKMGKKIIFICFLSTLIFSSYNGISQNLLPWRNDLINHKISKIIVTDNMVMNEKSKKKYVDTIKYDIYGNLTEKRITAFDTDSQRQYAGDWKYTYDSLGNRKLETRNSPDIKIMDYFNYVYDSNRIYKQIWVYWVNLKHIFDRVYNVQYDGYGRLNTEIIEDGTENVDTVISFKYDTLNRLYKILTTHDVDLKVPISLLTYFYNPDGTTSKTITDSKTAPELVEEFTYNQDRKVIKKESGGATTTYLYDKNGLLSEMDMVMKNQKGLKYKYALNYITR